MQLGNVERVRAAVTESSHNYSLETTSHFHGERHTGRRATRIVRVVERGRIDTRVTRTTLSARGRKPQLAIREDRLLKVVEDRVGTFPRQLGVVLRLPTQHSAIDRDLFITPVACA